ncbi:MAG: hypothetical protein J07HQW2_02812 [Haloquadratum walsbyi J07HQW2]|jgi:hypothetical protein|uniref:Uncharacterized protein n=1 Tax=Haloquadratum walsbyi J07HQW2 TaxID=1238425 RepID=U1NGT3_9EURY|nr:hypothetical protein [Haloquadratum walsbyi]ERG96335.1 MAG: hypothetical protein J07HQW2_02812 [Haloquadratum walsbyi J07HQW2]
MFFVDATTLVIGVVFLAVAGWIVSVFAGAVPRIEDFSEFLQNVLTGLTVQSLVRWMSVQLRVVGDLDGFTPYLTTWER